MRRGRSAARAEQLFDDIDAVSSDGSRPAAGSQWMRPKHGHPVRRSMLARPSANSAGSPLNLFTAKPTIRAASSGSRTARVPTRAAITPPRSMSPTRQTGTPAARAKPMLAMSSGLRVPTTRPCTTTCERRSECGFRSTRLKSRCGSSPAARACKACARPISPPSAQTAALLDMFCGLNGATRMPRRRASRHSPATMTDLPTFEPVP